MNSTAARAIREAVENYRRSPRTVGAKVRDAIGHAKQSPLIQMLEIEKQRRESRGRT